MIPEEELTALVSDLETDRVERKERATDLDRIRQAICAYANDLPNHARAGVVVVGMRDDGSCAHTRIDDRMLTTLGGLRSEGKILPFPVMQIDAKETAPWAVINRPFLTAIRISRGSRKLSLMARCGQIYFRSRYAPKTRTKRPEQDQ